MNVFAVVAGIIVLGGGLVVKNNHDELEFLKFDNLFKNAGQKYGVNWKWLKAIAMNESNLGKHPTVKRGLENPSDIEGSKSIDGLSWGLMQVTLKTAKSLDPKATPQKLNDPIYSVDLAARYVRDMMALFKTTDTRYVEWVIKSYNQGPGNTRKEITSGKGYANEYWSRFVRNFQKVEEKQS